eukprot:gb/GECG01002389.1/.p1 GENE.gb/GECG01002389.1/~~gb/GECG01002389.1/.p1  ORF type:complete len:283 (+),score=60.57 gb/GECG01002389.1/:1-849(+)
MDDMRKESRALEGAYGSSSGSRGVSFFSESMCEPSYGTSFAEIQEDGESTAFILEKQMSGHLYKRAMDGRNNWKKRYFVLKDGILLYYDPRDRPMVYFDFHPKGVLPLDSCTVDTCNEGPKRSMKFGIRITHPSFGKKSLILAAENGDNQDRWYQALENCRYITYNNAVTGAEQIDTLRSALSDTQTRANTLETKLRDAQHKLSSVKQKKDTLVQIIRDTERRHNIKVDLPSEVMQDDAVDDILESGDEDEEEGEEEEEEKGDTDNEKSKGEKEQESLEAGQ